MYKQLQQTFAPLISSFRDLLPIIIVIGCFQAFVLKIPLENTFETVLGTLMIAMGLALFIRGLELALFPIGESMAYAFARKGSISWLIIFAFCLGFGTTVAEPALIVVASEASEAAAQEQIIRYNSDDMDDYALGLRITVATAVGLAIILGVVRILKGWPLHYLIIGGYASIIVLTMFAPEEIIGIAYDSGGVTTSTVTVPLVTALGIGLASSIKGRNPMLDGFGLIAFASLTPIIGVMLYGMLF